jgi:hypothetical protein
MYEARAACRFIVGWISGVVVVMSVYMTGPHAPPLPAFFAFGPSEHFKILGVPIDTRAKYGAVVAYSLVNAVVRAAHTNVLVPWVINRVQDDDDPRASGHSGDASFAYEAILVSTVYHWFDWLLCLVVALSQVDMVLIEASADVLASGMATWMHLRRKSTDFAGTSLFTLLPNDP